MTLQELWKATTADIYLARKDREPLKLPSGGRLQIEHAEKKVWRIQIRTRASESPYLLVDTVEVGTDSHASAHTGSE